MRWCVALGATLWLSAASAQPVIEGGWDLRLEPAPVVSGLASPSALVFIGSRASEEFLVLEKDTGLVRHFLNRVEQPIALDLAVDNCGERGLVGIALHTDFDPTPTPVTDPPTYRPPSRDWVYLSYFTDPGRVSDGCDGDAVLHVERFKWDGTQLLPDPLVVPEEDPDPLIDRTYEPFVPFAQVVDSSTAVGGLIATNKELTPAFLFETRLYIAIGSLERDGTLQNNRLAPMQLDDTSVILRLDENGEATGTNPFDYDPDLVEPQDRYFAYGVHDPRGLVADPYYRADATSLWFTDRGDGGQPDEVARADAGTNGGYSAYQGFKMDPLPKPGEDAYPLVDLALDADRVTPVDTYRNPPFSFEAEGIEPTGLAFGGRAAGPRHIGSLFVGAEDGRLFRLAINSLRIGVSLSVPLADGVAAIDDDLSSILVGEGFGPISDVETGLDGSIYILGSTSGEVQRLYSDARHDLAITGVKVPTRITLSATRPTLTKQIRLTLENRGEAIEQILSHDEMDNLLGLEISGVPPAGCPAPTATVVDPWYVLPPYAYAIGIKPKSKLKVAIDVTWACDTPSPKDIPDFETSFDLNGAAIGMVDEDPANDLCPRPPSASDKGCGGKGGGPLSTDLIAK